MPGKVHCESKRKTTPSDLCPHRLRRRPLGLGPRTGQYRHLGTHWSAAASRLRTALMPRTELHLGARLLGLGRLRLLLGAWDLGACAAARLPLDPRILGLERRLLCLASRILGTPHRLLWRD